MRFRDLKQDRGVAGLTILLSLVTFLFIIGLLVMIFSLMGGELSQSDSVLKQFTSDSTLQNGTLDETGITLTACSSAPNGAITSLVVTNASDQSDVVPATNYSYSGCVVTGDGSSSYNSTTVTNTYTYTYSGASFDVMNETSTGISNVTDWFTIFIVIGAMVVLILLTVIIITAIRGSGLMGGEIASDGQGGQNIGTA